MNQMSKESADFIAEFVKEYEKREALLNQRLSAQENSFSEIKREQKTLSNQYDKIMELLMDLEDYYEQISKNQNLIMKQLRISAEESEEPLIPDKQNKNQNTETQTKNGEVSDSEAKEIEEAMKEFNKFK